MKPVIEINQLGKKYRIRQTEPYLALRDAITRSFTNMFREKQEDKKDFWALQDINLKIEAGERIGIIGRNGAGKSTLLKILSRITWPTTGHAIIRGRLASLLEVGTGFHPELSGRENIYLNGSILGLKKAEINKQFDAIVDFSGVETFLDTPLKNYSSGMQLRLAFAVAAHLEPEVLLIDEVLAVGDWEFQQKCIGKMEEVSKSHGRTILFVSHNLDTIRRFCSKTILLENGKIISQGNSDKVINEYLSDHLQTKAEQGWENGIISSDKSVKLNKVYLHSGSDQITSRFEVTDKIGITMEYEVLTGNGVFTHGLNLFNQENVNVFNSHDVVSPVRNEKRNPGKYVSTAWIPDNLLPEGIFSVSVALFQANPLYVYIQEHHVVTFETFTNFNKLSARGNYADEFPGIVRPLIFWETRKI
ncbi:MAG TPA: ABC transporter ATP-binding protein [Chitinophagaceae bacterium]